MNIMTWNCQGLRSPRTVHELTKLIRKFKPHIIFLIETKRKKSEMEWLRYKWDFSNCLTMDCIGRGGGLAMLWSSEV